MAFVTKNLGRGLILSSLALAGFSEAAILRIGVSRDASLIQQSLCCANPADTNFGAAATVDAGSYHNTARALFGFDLPKANQAWLKATLVLPASQLVGNSSAPFALSYTLADWDETKVTWNNGPDVLPLSTAEIIAETATSIDVTDAVNAAVLAGAETISFALDAQGQSNLFVPSKEAAGEMGAAALEIKADTSVQTGDDAGQDQDQNQCQNQSPSQDQNQAQAAED